MILFVNFQEQMKIALVEQQQVFQERMLDFSLKFQDLFTSSLIAQVSRFSSSLQASVWIQRAGRMKRLDSESFILKKIFLNQIEDSFDSCWPVSRKIEISSFLAFLLNS